MKHKLLSFTAMAFVSGNKIHFHHGFFVSFIFVNSPLPPPRHLFIKTESGTHLAVLLTRTPSFVLFFFNLISLSFFLHLLVFTF